MVTDYIILPFVVAKHGNRLVAGVPQKAKDANRAIASAERMAGQLRDRRARGALLTRRGHLRRAEASPARLKQYGEDQQGEAVFTLGPPGSDVGPLSVRPADFRQSDSDVRPEP